MSPSETAAALRAKIDAVCGFMGPFPKGACGRTALVALVQSAFRSNLSSVPLSIERTAVLPR